MFKQLKTEHISWIILLGLVFLILEIVFFSGGMLVALFLAIGCMYVGRKVKSGSTGRFLFWIGLIWLIILVLNMVTLKILLLILLFFILYQYYQSKQNPYYVEPVLQEVEVPADEPLQQKKPLLEHLFWGRQRTPEHAYEWDDVNIQSGIGDTVIDLSFTVLPKGEAVIVIRNMVGNVQVLIPYDMEVSVHHSVLVGSATIFQHHEGNLFNRAIYYQTSQYNETSQKIKIVTSMMAGKLEVKRI